MNVALGSASIAVGCVVSLVTVSALWRRVPPAVALALLAASGALIGAGALGVQDDVGAGDWILAVPVLAAVDPVHARLLFGSPGRRSVSAR